MRETGAQTLGRNVDRGRRPVDEDEDGVAARPDHSRHLVEERDHVQQDDEVECSVLERQAGGVRLLELDAAVEGVRKVPPRLGHHLAGEVDPDDLGVREALGDRECAGTRAGAEIERAPGRLDCLERGDERCEAVLGSDRLPTGSQEIELELHRPPQQAPERRPADDERRRNPGKATADREPDVHARMEMRATCPDQLASAAAPSSPVIDRYC